MGSEMYAMREEIVMQHDTATVKRLAAIQYKTFSAKKRLILYALSLICIALGFGLIYRFDSVIRLVVLAFGCILLVNVGASASVKADKTLRAIEAQGGAFPCTQMIFFDSSVKIKEQDSKPHTLKYNDILRLAEDRLYYYLFITTDAAYMVPRCQLRDEALFRKTLESRTGMRFSRPGSLLSLSLRDIKASFKR